MTLKSFAKATFVILSIATAICGFKAARLWYLSSLPTPLEFQEPQSSIIDDIEGHALGILVTLQSTQQAIAATSLLNKKAAIWSAWTAGFGAAAAVVSLFE